MSFSLVSCGITDHVIHDRYGKRSSDTIDGISQCSFPLKWRGVPEGTKSFAIVFIDHDNIEEEGVSWIHWLMANIPGHIGELGEDASRYASRIDKRIVQGKNTWTIEEGRQQDIYIGYGGPAPMLFPHEYEIRLYALEKYLNLQNGFTYNQMLKEIRGAILGESVLYALYHA